MDNKTKRQIQKTILEKLEEVYEFQSHPQAKIKGLQLIQNQEFGFLLRTFRIDQARDWCSLTEAHDVQILEVLDGLSTRRKIKVLRAGISREIHFNDIEFTAEIGRGVLEPRHSVVGWEISYKYFYWQPGRAMTKKEFEGFNPIVKPSDAVKNIRERRDQHFRERFGHSRETEILAELNKEAMLKKIVDKRAILRGNGCQS